MNQHPRHLLELTLATFFISTSGALGKFIAMPPPVTIWWRCLIAMIILYAFCKYQKINLRLNSKKDRLPFLISSLLLGAHWITYFYALKFSNVAIGMLSLFAFPVITALLEPLFGKEKFKPIHILLGCLILLGIYILAPEFSLENSHVKGILFGLLSAVCYSIRILMLKQQVNTYNGTMLMFYQLLILTIMLVPVLYFMDASGIQSQFPFVILLAVVTTALGHTMFVKSLNHFSASTATIISSTQPIFGIIIAYFFLNEMPTWSTFWGGLLILSTVVIESIRSKKEIKKGENV